MALIEHNGYTFERNAHSEKLVAAGQELLDAGYNESNDAVYQGIIDTLIANYYVIPVQAC